VRVHAAIGGANGDSITRVGMIACEGEAANSFDIIFGHKSNFAELPSEENGGFVNASDITCTCCVDCERLRVGVPAVRLRRLEPFELATPVDITTVTGNPQQYYEYLLALKDQANALFELKDIDSAYMRYASLLSTIQHMNPPSTGCTVIVLPDPAATTKQTSSSSATSNKKKVPLDASTNLNFPSGTITDDLDDDKFEVEFDDNDDDEDADEEDVAGSCIASAGQLVCVDGCCARWSRSSSQEAGDIYSPKIWDIQRAANLNLCRCALKW
jgi:hypothetical protein